MRKLALLAVASASALSFTGTAQAANCVMNAGVEECFIVAGLDPEFSVTFNLDGTISASIGRDGIGNHNFIDRYFFFTETDGLGSGGIETTVAGDLGTSIDLDLTNVVVNTGGTFNDVAVPYAGVSSPAGIIVGGVNYPISIIDLGDGWQVAGVSGGNSIPINGFQANYIQISGLARGNGSYGGNVTFIPNAAVPEPATWGMMLLGFGAIGFGMRRRRKETARVRFAF